jgi:hypothetical protein
MAGFQYSFHRRFCLLDGICLCDLVSEYSKATYHYLDGQACRLADCAFFNSFCVKGVQRTAYGLCWLHT